MKAKKITNTTIFECGKCKDGKIETTHKFDGETNELNIKRCSNQKCKYQYTFKQLCFANLKSLTNQRN